MRPSEGASKFDHLIGDLLQAQGHVKPERPGCL
jgi:hypothetical protein